MQAKVQYKWGFTSLLVRLELAHASLKQHAHTHLRVGFYLQNVF